MDTSKKKKMTVVVHQCSPSLLSGTHTGFPTGWFGVGSMRGCTDGAFFAEKDDFQNLNVYRGAISFPLPPSLKTRRSYSTNSNQPLPSESASATHSKSDESESCDGNQPFFQCCATNKHGANTSVFHGPSACGNGTDTSYGHCGFSNKDGPGAEREHCRINDPTSSQYRNPAVSVPVYKYN